MPSSLARLSTVLALTVAAPCCCAISSLLRARAHAAPLLPRLHNDPFAMSARHPNPCCTSRSTIDRAIDRATAESSKKNIINGHLGELKLGASDWMWIYQRWHGTVLKLTWVPALVNTAVALLIIWFFRSGSGSGIGIGIATSTLNWNPAWPQWAHFTTPAPTHPVRASSPFWLALAPAPGDPVAHCVQAANPMHPGCRPVCPVCPGDHAHGAALPHVDHAFNTHHLHPHVLPHRVILLLEAHALRGAST